MSEKWLPVVGYENIYEVSALGRVRSVRTHRTIKAHPNNKGYLVVDLYRDRARKKHLLHRLVAVAFVLNPDDLPEVNHEDGNKTNCAAVNLAWTTRLDNVRHAVEAGLVPNCDRHGMAKLTPAKVMQMREDASAGDTLAVLAKRYGITFGRAGAIVRGDSWKKCGGPLTRRGFDHARRPR